MNLALFDFDGTITTSDTFSPFVRFAVRPGRMLAGTVLLALVLAVALPVPAAAQSRETGKIGSASARPAAVAPIHIGRLTIPPPRPEPQSMMLRSTTPAVQGEQSQKRPGLWAAVGAGVGAGLGVVYARAGHPGLPHAPGGDTADEVLYVPLFGGIGAVVGWVIGSR